MTFGIIGLGRMGHAIAQRVLNAGITVVGFDVDAQAKQAAQTIGVHVAASVQEVAQHADVVWLMLPAGQLVDDTIEKLLPTLPKDAVIIDGGNSNYKDSAKRAERLEKKDVFYLDCGTSGGLYGKEIGFSLMVGGQKQAYECVLPILKAIAAQDGVGLVGPSGAGHYVKMVHNGIEYALLQAYSEGFHIIKKGHYKDVPIDLAQVTGIWQHGSVIRSYLLELAHKVFRQDQELTDVSGEIAESGTGAWTVQEAHEQHIPAPTIEDALQVRKFSRETGGNFATKVVALLRNAFGGHTIKRKET